MMKICLALASGPRSRSSWEKRCVSSNLRPGDGWLAAKWTEKRCLKEGEVPERFLLEEDLLPVVRAARRQGFEAVEGDPAGLARHRQLLDRAGDPRVAAVGRREGDGAGRLAAELMTEQPIVAVAVQAALTLAADLVLVLERLTATVQAEQPLVTGRAVRARQVARRRSRRGGGEGLLGAHWFERHVGEHGDEDGHASGHCDHQLGDEIGLAVTHAGLLFTAGSARAARRADERGWLGSRWWGRTR
jgi:hypothetical protein